MVYQPNGMFAAIKNGPHEDCIQSWKTFFVKCHIKIAEYQIL